MMTMFHKCLIVDFSLILNTEIKYAKPKCREKQWPFLGSQRCVNLIGNAAACYLTDFEN
jgi:hypothetical protein